MMSWNAFSQTDTTSSTIQLTKPIAKLVIKDLIKFDGLSGEVLSLQQVLSETNKKVEIQDRLLTNLNSQVANYKSILDKKDQQLGTSAEMAAKLTKELKKEAAKKKIYQFGTVIVGVAAVLSIL